MMKYEIFQKKKKKANKISIYNFYCFQIDIHQIL